jgi:hypothetical protein
VHLVGFRYKVDDVVCMRGKLLCSRKREFLYCYVVQLV